MMSNTDSACDGGTPNYELADKVLKGYKKTQWLGIKFLVEKLLGDRYEYSHEFLENLIMMFPLHLQQAIRYELLKEYKKYLKEHTLRSLENEIGNLCVDLPPSYFRDFEEGGRREDDDE